MPSMDDLWRCPIGALVRTCDGDEHAVVRVIYSHYERLDGTIQQECRLTFLLDDGRVLDPDTVYRVIRTGRPWVDEQEPRRCRTCQEQREQEALAASRIHRLMTGGAREA